MSPGGVVAILIGLVAITLWRPLRAVRAALDLTHLLATGHAFLVLGLLLGLSLDAATERALSLELTPLISFVAGWIGFSVGVGFELRVLRRLPGRLLAVAWAPALVAAAAVGAGAWPLLILAGASHAEAACAAIVVGAAAANSAPTLAALLRRRRAGRLVEVRPTLRMVELSATLDDALVVVLALTAFALFRPPAEATHPLLLVSLSIGAGAVLGVCAMLLLRGRASDDERLLLGLAVLTLAAGVATWLHVSPTALAATTGFVLVNAAGDRAAALVAVIRKAERPAVVVLMTVIGLHAASADSWLTLAIVGLMTVGRGLAKLAGGRALSRVQVPVGGPLSANWALGLAPQGALGPMIALTLFHVWQDDTARAVLGAVALASLLNEALAPALLARAVRVPRRGAPA